MEVQSEYLAPLDVDGMGWKRLGVVYPESVGCDCRSVSLRRTPYEGASVLTGVARADQTSADLLSRAARQTLDQVAPDGYLAAMMQCCVDVVGQY
jgi:hypothetical protein